MKTIARIATALTAALASVFVAAPAFAAEAGEKFNPQDEFRLAGEPLQVYAIIICGAIILAVVLGLAYLVGRLFDVKKP